MNSLYLATKGGYNECIKIVNRLINSGKDIIRIYEECEYFYIEFEESFSLIFDIRESVIMDFDNDFQFEKIIEIRKIVLDEIKLNEKE